MYAPRGIATEEWIISSGSKESCQSLGGGLVLKGAVGQLRCFRTRRSKASERKSPLSDVRVARDASRTRPMLNQVSDPATALVLREFHHRFANTLTIVSA